MPAKMRRKLAQPLTSNNRRNACALKLRSTRLSHKDRAKKSLRIRGIRSGSHKLRNRWRFFNQPCVRVKILLQVGQAPLGEILIAPGIEKEIVRNIDRRCWRSALDFLGRSHLFFARVPVGPVKGKEKNVARRRNTLRVEEQFRLSPKHEDTLFG